MRRRLWTGVSVALTLLAIGLSHAGSRETAVTAFREGVRLYEEERFPQALSAWRRVLQEGYGSAELFLNLGNAAYKSAELGWAVYYYELARRRSPRDPDIQTNLALARRNALGAEIETERSALLDPIVRMQNWWTVPGAVKTALCLLWVACGIVAIHWLTGWDRLRRFSRGLAISLSLLAVLLMGAKLLQNSLSPDALAVQPIAARSEPDPQATVELRLPQGSPINLGRSAPGWREIVVSASLRGWVPVEEVGEFGKPR